MMPEEKEAISMYERVRRHDEEISRQEERIEALEEADRRHEARLKVLEDNAIRLENTIMSENRETRTTMKEQTDKLHDLVKQSMDFATSADTRKHELKLARMNTWSTIILKAGAGLVALGSAGGGLFLLIDYLITK